MQAEAGRKPYRVGKRRSRIPSTYLHQKSSMTTEKCNTTGPRIIRRGETQRRSRLKNLKKDSPKQPHEHARLKKKNINAFRFVTKKKKKKKKRGKEEKKKKKKKKKNRKKKKKKKKEKKEKGKKKKKRKKKKEKKKKKKQDLQIDLRDGISRGGERTRRGALPSCRSGPRWHVSPLSGRKPSVNNL